MKNISFLDLCPSPPVFVSSLPLVPSLCLFVSSPLHLFFASSLPPPVCKQVVSSYRHRVLSSSLHIFLDAPLTFFTPASLHVVLRFLPSPRLLLPVRSSACPVFIPSSVSLDICLLLFLSSVLPLLVSLYLHLFIPSSPPIILSSLLPRRLVLPTLLHLFLSSSLPLDLSSSRRRFLSSISASCTYFLPSFLSTYSSQDDPKMIPK